MRKKILITENQKKALTKYIKLTEGEVSHLIPEFLKAPSSFASLISACNQEYVRVGSGSARTVYEFNDTLVLKVAKNKKGFAQNNLEVETHVNNYAGAPLANIVEFYDDVNMWWVIVEKANKITSAKFKEINGFPMKLFFDVLFDDVTGVLKYENYGGFDALEPIFENELYQGVRSLCIDMSYGVGDLVRPSSYGWVKHPDGTEEVVLIDYGLNMDISQEYYHNVHENIIMEGENSSTDESMNEKIALIKSCISEVADKLGLCEIPKITLKNSPDYTRENKSFASYNPTSGEIICSIYQRNTADILRSITHELVHHKQNLEGRLYSGAGDDGSDIENEANSDAGKIMREIGREVDNIFEDITLTEGKRIVTKAHFIEKTRYRKL